MSEKDEINKTFGGNNFQFNTIIGDYKLKGIEVYNALKKDISADSLYEKSGLKLILQPLLKQQEFKNVIRGGFIEVSTFASTIHDNKLDAFNLSFIDLTSNESINRQFHSNISNYFKKIISKLRKEHFILFNHPDFTNEPNDIRNFISTIYDNEEIYNRDIVALVQKKYSDLENLTNEEARYDATHDQDKISDRIFSIQIRKSELHDSLTSWEGISQKMPDLVKGKIDQEFDYLLTIEERLFAAHFLNHKLYHEKFQVDLKYKSRSFFISIPLLDPHPVKENCYIGLGAVFIFLLIDNDRLDPNRFKKNIEEYCRKIPGLVKGYLTGYVSQIGIEKLEQINEKLQQIRKEATKSAIAAVMSRNMSHNLGSHPIPQFNEKIKELKKKNSLEDWQDLSDKIIGYNKHLQERMEFVADVSSATQSHIYIEYDFQNICEKIRAGINGNMEIIMKGLIDGYVGSNPLQLAIDIPEENFPVDIRGDNLGVQALHVIIENIVRNTYKHSNPKINTRGERLIHIRIKISKLDETSGLADDYYAIDIFDLHSKTNPERNNSILDGINHLISQNILDKNSNSLRDEGWGLLEMKGAAAYLIGFPFEMMNEVSTSIINASGDIFPIPITAHFYNDDGVIDNMSKNLGYRFYLPKPKFCLIHKSVKLEFLEENLKKEGIEIGDKQGSRHRFFITQNELNNFSNQRTVLAEDEMINKLKRGDIDSFKKILWKNYITERYGQNSLGREIINATDIDAKKIDNPDSIIFDTHGHNITYNNKFSKNFRRKDLFIRNNPVFYYYESFPSASSFSSDFLNDRIKRNMLYESAVIKEALFDERIQEATEKYDSNQHGLMERDILEAAGIFVPDKATVNLRELVTEKTDSLKLKLRNELYLKASFCEYIIIHQTLIEILVGRTNKSDLKNWIDQFEENTELSKNKKALIITSGRGRTSNIPDETFYLNFSTLNEYVVTRRSKLKLVNVLKLLRKK